MVWNGILKDNIMNFVEWFDPYNKRHIEAYKYLSKNGIWPKNFIPENVEMDFHWQYNLFVKIAECWVENFKPNFFSEAPKKKNCPICGKGEYGKDSLCDDCYEEIFGSRYWWKKIKI